MVYTGDILAWFTTIGMYWHGLEWGYTGMVYCGAILAWFNVSFRMARFIVGLDL